MADSTPELVLEFVNMEFNTHRVKARKDLLDFVREIHEGDLLKQIGSDFKRWIEELGMINYLVTGTNLVAGIGARIPEEKDLQMIGENVYFQNGNKNDSKCFWRCEDGSWTQYHIMSHASLKINPSFNVSFNVSLEDLLPENFERRSQKIEAKRKVFKFDVNGFSVYAKGAEIIKSFYYRHSIPSYRLTDLSRVQKISSESEAEKTIALMDDSIKVPEIIGYYQSDFEEFLFVKEVKGEMPDKYIRSHRDEIIRQDSVMLAKLCKLGYRKQWFADFDDKIFDGKDLYLIDVEDITDLYSHGGVDFRKVLLDPSSKYVDAFRKYQKTIFLRSLKDAIYDYKNDLLSHVSHKRQYIKHFFETMKWHVSEKEIRDLTTFPDNYTTRDSALSMMMEEAEG